jgi:hypothetical protein
VSSGSTPDGGCCVRGGRTCVLSRGAHGPVQGQISCSCPYMHTMVVSSKREIREYVSIVFVRASK